MATPTKYYVWTDGSGKIYKIAALAQGRPVEFNLETKEWEETPMDLMRKAYFSPDHDMDQVKEADAVKAGATVLTEEMVAHALGYPGA